jgi:cyclic pyranopterin phosphate synthase
MIFSRKKLTHIDKDGNAVMVDVSDKKSTAREAIAKGTVMMELDTLKMIDKRTHKKGDVLAIAQLAGIQAAKRTSDLIPLCHPLMLTSVKVELETDEKKSAVHITATCKLVGQTGVEMEALTAVSAAALTVYDMCKSVDRGMHITDIRVVKKSGGKSGTFEQE